MAFGVTSAGISIETEQEVLDRLAAQARATISPSLDVSQNSVIGRLLAIFAQEVAQNQEIMQAVYQSGSEQADGQSLDNRSALTGTTRRAATFSTVTATVGMDAFTSISAGEIIASVAGSPDRLFTNTESYTSSGETSGDIAFIAVSPGRVLAPAGDLTELEVSISGINTITNASDATPGEDRESDTSLRLRRRAELSAQGTGTVDSIRADVLQVTDVEYVKVLENRTDFTVGTLTPHSFEVVAFGGLDTAIAQAIWDGMPSGIGNLGSSSATATDDGGNSQTVYFTRPTNKRVYVDVTLTYDADSYGGDAAVQAAIASFTNGSLDIELPNGTILDGATGVGDDLILAKLYNAIYTVEGVEDVTLIEADFTSSPTGTVNLTITDREIISQDGTTAGIDSADVTVNSTAI